MTALKSHPARRWRHDAPAKDLARDLAQETAVAIGFNGASNAVLMATPADIEDLAVGFVVTERIAAFEQIRSIRVETLAAGLQVEVAIDGKPQLRERKLSSRTSCGLCGVTTLRDAVRPLPAVGVGFQVGRAAIQRSLAGLEEQQSLGRLTRATHAAALADPAGRVVLVREDVGRHNALDKLIGAALRGGLDPAGHFMVITSRCSFEMVDKAAIAGCPILVAVSAPTALAVDRALEAGMTLVALARADGHTVFCGAERIV